MAQRDELKWSVPVAPTFAGFEDRTYNVVLLFKLQRRQKGQAVYGPTSVLGQPPMQPGHGYPQQQGVYPYQGYPQQQVVVVGKFATYQ